MSKIRFVVFVLISFGGIEGIRKDNATTQKRKNAAKRWLRFLTIIIKNLRVIAIYEIQAKSDKLPFPSILLTLHDHKQQLTFLQRFKLIGLHPA